MNLTTKQDETMKISRYRTGRKQPRYNYKLNQPEKKPGDP
jgi:hypothetical protein